MGLQGLRAKEESAYQTFRQAIQLAELDQIAVAWTGGKDSTLVLYLWRNWLVEQGFNRTGALRALSVDTGWKFPEAIAFRDELAQRWGVNVHVCRPKVDSASYPVAQDVVQCCRDLKIKPLQEGISQTGTKVLLTGLRHDEHPQRQQLDWWEEESTPPHYRVHPLIEWTEMDIWSMHLQVGLAYCPLYDQGYRSLGCRPCTRVSRQGLKEREGRNPDKEAQLDTLRSLGYF